MKEQSMLARVFTRNKKQSDDDNRIIYGDETDDQFMNKVQRWWDESLNLYTERLKIKNDNEALYKGEHPFDGDPDKQSAVVHNKIFENIDTYEANMTNKLPEPVGYVTSEDNMALEAAREVEQAILYVARRDNMLMKMESVARNMLLHRDAYVMIMYDAQKGKYGEITHEVIDPKNIRLCPAGNPYSFGDYLFITVPRDYRWAIEHFPDKAEVIKRCYSGYDMEEEGKSSQVQIVDVWYWQYDKEVKRMVPWHCVYLKEAKAENILVQERTPYWDFEGELSREDQVAYDEAVSNVEKMALVQGEEAAQTMLDEINHEYDEKRVFRNFLEEMAFPVVGFHTFVDENKPISITSIPEQVKSLQISLNNGKRMVEDNGKLMVKGRVIKDSDSGVKRITGIAGEVITKKPGTTVQFVDGTPLPSEVFNNIADSEKAIDNIAGANDISKGIIPSNTQARTAILAAEKDQGRTVKLTRKFEDGIEQVYNWDVHMMKLFWGEERIIPLIDPAGTERNAFITISNDKILDSMQFYVKPGSAKEDSQREKAARADELYSKQLIDPITYFERTGDVPDPEAAAKRLEDWKAGRLFAPPIKGPEDQAREIIDMLRNRQYDVPKVDQPTEESIQIMAKAIQDTSNRFDDRAIEILNELMQQDMDVVDKAVVEQTTTPEGMM